MGKNNRSLINSEVYQKEKETGGNGQDTNVQKQLKRKATGRILVDPHMPAAMGFCPTLRKHSLRPSPSCCSAENQFRHVY